MMTETVTMPSRKNIYIRDEDQDLLREFESDGGNASELFSKSLKRHIDEERERKEQEKAARGQHGRIIVELLDQYGIFRKKAFQGRWLLDPEALGSGGIEPQYWGIAETQLGRIVVVHHDDERETDPSTFKVMTLEEFRENDSVPADIKADALEVLGEDYVEELDI